MTGAWIAMMAREPGAPPSPAASSGPLTDMLLIRRVEMGGGKAVFELEVSPDILNPNGVLASPAVYAMVDYSMGAATASALNAGQVCATIEIKISYFASVRSGKVRAETEVIRKDRRIAFLESRVRDDSGKLIAAATGSFFILDTANRAAAPAGKRPGLSRSPATGKARQPRPCLSCLAALRWFDSGHVKGFFLGALQVVVLARDDTLGVKPSTRLHVCNRLPSAVRVRGQVPDRMKQPRAILAVHPGHRAHVLAHQRTRHLVLEVRNRRRGQN